MVGLWKATRILRWLLIPIYAAYLVDFTIHRQTYLDWRGLLALSTEAVMFGIPILFVFLGLMETMLRERTGVYRGPAILVSSPTPSRLRQFSGNIPAIGTLIRVADPPSSWRRSFVRRFLSTVARRS